MDNRSFIRGISKLAVIPLISNIKYKTQIIISEIKLTIGQAIDKIIEALESLDETTRQTAINAACTHLNLTNVSQSIQPKLTPEQINLQTLPHAHAHIQSKLVDIRTFKEQKDPKSAIQMACLVAYYLQELAPMNEKKNTVTAADLSTYFKQANFKLPKVITQVLPDARVAGYFESAPGKGEYSLNAVGYNLVAHNLPKTSK